jgi:HK97 family phage prohead protease
MNMIHRGVLDLQISTRLLDLRPTSFDDTEHTVEAILSMGSPVPRFYGIESLRITKDAIDLSRMQTTGIPVIDSHQQTSIDHALGKLTDAWVSNGGLFGVIKFNRTDAGMRAEGMIKRGELGGVSVGYRVLEWEVQDGDGNILDPDHFRWGDDDLTFVGKNWELLEVSICAVPADAQSGFRNIELFDRAYLSSLPPHLVDIHARMLARARMVERQSEMQRDW